MPAFSQQVTASFAYVRGHGPGGRHVGCYPSPELDRGEVEIEGRLAGGRDVYPYVDNDVEGAAALDARDMISRLAGAD